MSLVRRLASQSSIIFAARIAGAGFVFLAQALIARSWGAGILGEYLVVIACVNLVSMVMPLGFHTVGTYFAAEYRAKGNRGQLKAFLTRSYGQVLAVFALFALLGPVVLELIGQGDSTVASHYMAFLLSALASAIIYVNGALLVGLRRPLAGFLAESIFRPMIVLGSFFVGLAFTAPEMGFSAMLWVMALVYLGVALAHFALAVVTLRSVADEAPAAPAETSRWWRFALPWVLISLATDFFFDIDLLLLSTLLTKEDLAVFGVCTRIFSLVAFGVSAVYAVTLPDIFESEANADREAFHRKVGEANMVASLAATALFVGASVMSPFALLIFGPDFAAGALPLSLLCLALVVRSIMGPASVVLSIHDRPWSSLPAIALGMATLVAANFVLVPPMGLVGAALAAILSISLWSVALWFTALRIAKIDVSILQWFRSRRLAKG